MGNFVNNEWFEIEHCCNCGMAFAMTRDFHRRRLENKGSSFYCPAGHGQHYTGPTEAQKLKKELEAKSLMLEAANHDVVVAKMERDKVAKSHLKMRKRVMNGVCPCCNRTFQNLMSHMKTEHPEFKEIQTVAALRQAFGMTQSDVAREAGVYPVSISLYERGKPVSDTQKRRIDAWADRHNAAA